MALKSGGTLLNGQYEIVRQLGRGGFGFVYLANDRLLGEQVALKELIPALVGDETVLKRFLAEARATIRLTHERIVRTYNVFSEAGNYYIAMEYMAGGTLEERLKDRGPMPPGEAARITAEVCEGLYYAHQRGVVHCDLKPANILFTADPLKKTGASAKVGDFGIAHISDSLVDRTWHTSLGFVAGTLPYMSPEQAEGVRNDPRIDIYALGAVLYRMLTGRSYLEFDQRTTPAAQVENVMRIRSLVATPPSSHVRGIPAWLDAVVLRALAKQTGDRYSSAEEMRQAVLRPEVATYVDASVPPLPAAAPSSRPGASTPRPVTSTPRPAPAEAARPRSAGGLPGWFWLLAAAVVLLCLGIGIVGAILLSGGGGQSTPPVTFIVVAPDTATPEPTLPVTEPLPPTATLAPDLPTATLDPQGAIYGDDFSDENSGWGQGVDNDTETSYENGEYRVAVNRTDYVAWGYAPTMDLGDYQVEVDARAVEGPINNNLGLLVRYQEATDDFYWFQVSADGYYAVDLFYEGQFTSILAWEESTAINQGLEVTNHLAVLCSGDQYSLYVNGVHLADVSDATLSGGTVGLAAGSFDEAGVVIHFDNIVVSSLP